VSGAWPNNIDDVLSTEKHMSSSGDVTEMSFISKQFSEETQMSDGGVLSNVGTVRINSLDGDSVLTTGGAKFPLISIAPGKQNIVM